MVNHISCIHDSIDDNVNMIKIGYILEMIYKKHICFHNSRTNDQLYQVQVNERSIKILF